MDAGGNVLSNNIDVAVANKNRRKRIGLVFLVIMVVVALGVGIFILLFQNQQKYDDSAFRFFNRHANYLLFDNEDESNVLSDLDLDAIYACDCNEKNEKECESFFIKAKELLDSFTNNYDYENKLDEIFVEDIKYYLQTFESYYIYATVGLLDGDEILMKYNNNGYEAAKEYIDSYYSKYLEESNGEDLINYGNYQIARATAELDIIKASDDAGCLEGQEYDQECVSELVIDDELSARMQDLLNDDYMNGFIKSKRRDMINGAVFICRLLNYKQGDNNEN